MLALSFARCRGASLEIPLLCQLVSGWFNPSLPPRFENEERGQLGWEGWGGWSPLHPEHPSPRYSALSRHISTCLELPSCHEPRPI